MWIAVCHLMKLLAWSWWGSPLEKFRDEPVNAGNFAKGFRWHGWEQATSGIPMAMCRTWTGILTIARWTWIGTTPTMPMTISVRARSFNKARLSRVLYYVSEPTIRHHGDFLEVGLYFQITLDRNDIKLIHHAEKSLQYFYKYPSLL